MYTKNLIFIFFVSLSCVAASTLDYELVTDYTVNDCLRVDNEKKLKYFGVDSNGFPYCEKYNVPSSCDPNVADSCEPGLVCGPFKTCQVDTTSCFKYYANVLNNEKIEQLLWTPDCLEDGSWSAKQCKGGTAGRCFCYDKKGSRLFGDAFTENSVNMTCACSRRKAELLDSTSSNKRSYVSFHCDNQGNYEELQCDSENCWCVEPKTGELTSMIVPEKAIKYLPCSTKLKGSQYLRKCESQAYAQAKVSELMKRHGTTSPNIQIIACGNDGAYGPYTIQNAEVYCVTRSNAKMSYQTTIKEIKSINCNCARDEDLYKRLGKAFTLVCSSNGNYKPFQSILEEDKVKSFCVDKDGNKKVDNVDPDAEDKFCNDYYD